MELYFFPHIESARILPFTKKRSISVDALQIEKYIDNIVIPIARYHDIETHGLNITEEECACEAVLSFEDATYNGQALQLVFRYGDQTFAPDSANEMKKIIYRKTSGEIGFFPRNITVEEQAVQLLTNAGLQQLNATHFQLSAKAPEKTISNGSTIIGRCCSNPFTLPVM